MRRGAWIAVCLWACGEAASAPVATDAGTGGEAATDGAATSSSTTASVGGGGGGGGEAPTPVDLRIAVLSDLNGSYGSTSYSATVVAGVDAVIDRLAPELVLITGDMVAGQKAGLDYEAMWSAFHATVTERLHAAGIPLAVTPGNHDASGYAAFAGERAIFVEEWSTGERIPPVTMVDAEDYPLRYSFEHQGVFFVSLDATTVGALSESQRAWVETQLAASTHPVKIAFGHLPLHAVAQGREDQILGDEALEEVFREEGLDLYVSGHHHAYYPGARDGLRLVSTSCLGGGARRLVGEDAVSPKSVLEIVVEDGALTSVEAWRAPDFDVIIARDDLPSALEHQGKRVDRDDLAGF